MTLISNCKIRRKLCGTIRISSVAVRASKISRSTQFLRESVMNDRFAHWNGRLPHWPARLGISETQRFLLLALLIGIFAGLIVVLFHISIDFVSWTTLGALSGRFRFARLLSPAVGEIGRA